MKIVKDKDDPLNIAIIIFFKKTNNFFLRNSGEDSTVSDRINDHRVIIAIEGAKGGIGKSIFAANLGVFLASKGKRTVLVDLELIFFLHRVSDG